MSGISVLENPSSIFTALTVGAALKYASSLWMRKQYCRKSHCVGKISSIFYYPVKSLRGIELQKAEATKLGIHYDGVTDRHWLVTRNGEFLSQRQEARLSLISVEIRKEELRLDAVGMETLVLPVHPVVEKSKIDRISVRKQTVDALDCGDEASKWISRFMKIDGLKIYCTRPSLEKRTSAMDRGREHGALLEDKVAFHDYSSYMVMTDASLEKLNTMIPRPVPKINFRPNFIVSGCEAFDEDTWKELRVGDAVFRKIDACTRCVMTTIDISTGKKSEDGEPLKTLKKFRMSPRFGERPAFGISCAIDKEGTIKIGDPVYAICS